MPDGTSNFFFTINYSESLCISLRQSNFVRWTSRLGNSLSCSIKNITTTTKMFFFLLRPLYPPTILSNPANSDRFYCSWNIWEVPLLFFMPSAVSQDPFRHALMFDLSELVSPVWMWFRSLNTFGFPCTHYAILYSAKHVFFFVVAS